MGRIPVTWAKLVVLAHPGQFADPPIRAVNEAASAVALVGALALVPLVRRRVGLDAAVLVVGAALVAWVGTRGFAPAGRFLLPAVPAGALAVGDALQGRRVLVAAIALVGAVAALALAVGFAQGGDLWLEW